MRLTARALLLLAAASGLAAAPAFAQQPGRVRIDPCTGKPEADPSRPDASAEPKPGGTPSAGTPSAGAAAPMPGSPMGTQPGTPSGTPATVTQPGVSSGTPAAGGAPGSVPSAGATLPCPAAGPAMNAAAARRMRQSLRLGRDAVMTGVRLGPAASVSVPTGFGVDAGELFVGVAYQGRTRYTEEDDAAFVAGLGLGRREKLAVELALTSYSTIRGAPFETGGVSVRVHRALTPSTSVGVGWENALLWGGSDDEGSLYAAASHTVSLRADPSRRFSTAVFTLGVGNGRFRFEEDDAEGNETVNVFAAAGVRVSEPLSLVADWTGQDLNLAASITPVRRVPLVLTTGVADVTGLAGDGARFILSLGYGLSIRQPF